MTHAETACMAIDSNGVGWVLIQDAWCFVEMASRHSRRNAYEEKADIKDGSLIQELNLDSNLAWEDGLVPLGNTALLMMTKPDLKPQNC